jgi:hypothetical protein
MQPGDLTIDERVERTDPQTGRRIVQLTSGPWDDYPLYYFIPTVTQDGRSLILHRLRDGQLQYHRLDLDTGRTVCLTAARTPVALWRPWTQAPTTGVREYLGALNLVTDELIYLDGQDIRAVHIRTLADRLVARVPEDRFACSQAGISPDGRFYTYAHADRAWWDSHTNSDPQRHTARGCKIEVLELASGASRTILTMNGWISHTTFYDDTRIIFSHPPTEQGILMTDLIGTWMLALRPQSPDGSQTCHYQATRSGVMYELNTYTEPIDRRHGTMGVFDPDTLTRREYRVGARITHIGFDPEGWLWFGEQIRETPRFGRLIGYVPKLDRDREAEFVPLTEPVMTCGDQHLQRAHVHPALMPDRRHILFTAGDPRTGTNHPCLLDVADLAEVKSERA